MRRRQFQFIARLFSVATLALISSVAASSAGRSPVTRLDALPRTDERLAQPIFLPHCGMRIVEWRSTPALRAETTPSGAALTLIDQTCRDAFGRYGDFLRAQKLPQLRKDPDVLPEISLLPGNVLLDGKVSRALNDLPTRFEAVAPGCCYWGLYVDSLNHLFLRNDPLVKDEVGALVPNPRFVRTLIHEISHVLSSQLRVWDAVSYDRQRDEDLAEEFVAYMGIRFPTDSSTEDLAFHRGHPTVRGSPAAESTATAGGSRSRAEHDPPANASANTSSQQ
jgi:hypothetical protein